MLKGRNGLAEKGIRTFYIETYGCQMNLADSELVESLLGRMELDAVAAEDEADLVLINTCGVREHAERRVLSRVNQLKTWKRQSGRRLLGVIGCMAQRMGESLQAQAPWVDLVAGPDTYRSLPEMIERLCSVSGGRESALEFDIAEDYRGIEPARREPWTAWVPVTRGCDNFCSYCIVPYVRGRERSVDAVAVEQQVRRAVDDGTLEVVLLGQNVNSYSAGGEDFASLLYRLDAVDGLRWIRFITSHPRDLSDRIIEAMAECDKVCEHLHLPVQSGSPRVLGAMNRGYDRDYYLGRVEKLRGRIPSLSLTSDILVGFPGETEDDFRETVSLMQEVRFDYCYTFRYSPRPGTRAARMEDDVPEREKIRRLNEVIELQRGHTAAALESLRGETLEVIPATRARKGRGIWQAKTRLHFSMFLPAGPEDRGQARTARITGNTGMNLRGELLRGSRACR